MEVPSREQSEQRAPRADAAERRASIAFYSVEGIGPNTLERLRRTFGSLSEALAAPRERVAALLLPQALPHFEKAGDLGAVADRHLESAARLGAEVVVPGDPGWPGGDGDHPPLLYVRGRLDRSRPRVAIVGSRTADRYGLELTVFFASALARAGVCIVSGGAYGVDAAAHRSAVEHRAPTVAVLGCGIERAYPDEHAPLFEELLARGGALVTQFPPGTPPVPRNFHVRNRTIAWLAQAVLVTQASDDSGAMSTASAALELKRPVFAVPGDVTQRLSTGVNQLIESGSARAVSGLAPLARALKLKGDDWPSAAPSSRREERPRRRPSAEPAPLLPKTAVPSSEPPQGLAPPLLAIYELLGPEPVQFDELVVRSGLTAPELSRVLLELELAGHCVEREGKTYLRR